MVQRRHPVQSLNTAEVDGKYKLFAILCSNRDLIYDNQSGQYQLCFIELFENVATWGRSTCWVSASPISPTRG
ncbi:hypothetical protein [Aeromonas hydrophila]|uniref:hypothetical protein n=1 Tax=Aeromonas hydrophila TaxID=644 RepID=UPI002B46330F|nr:hypothetical protein [Aeromonas hydrophila]